MSVNWKDLTINQANDLGLRKFKKDEDLWLIPIGLLEDSSIKPGLIGIELTSITGKKIIYDGNNIDLDTRFGFIGYGISIKE